MATTLTQRTTAAWGDNDVPDRSAVYEMKRMALIRQAGRTFAVKGYHNTSLDDVARELKVTKPALYHYVRTKEEILFECHNIALDLGEQARKQASEEVSTAGERLRRTLTLYIHAAIGEIGTYAVLTEPMSSLSAPLRERVLKRRRAADKALRELVRGAIEEGAIRPCDPKLAVAFFMSAINGLSRWFSASGERSGEEVAAEYVRFIFDGLGAAPERPKKRP